MIELFKVTKYYPTHLGPHYVFRDVSLKLPRDMNIGVIGANGSGKTTLLRLLTGADIPSSGRIERTGRISWPMGLTAGLQRTLTGRENARFLCRIYGMPAHKIKSHLGKIQDISQVGKFFDMPVASYSAGMVQRVSFAISISLGFDYYVFDEISAGGDLMFGGLAQGMMQDRLRSSRFVLASHNLAEVQKLCNAVIVLNDGQLNYFDDVKAGIDAYVEQIKGKARSAAPADPQKVARMVDSYVTLSRDEMRLARSVGQAADQARAEELRRRLQNTRILLQDLALQLRLNNCPVPSAEEIARLAARPEVAAPDTQSAQRLVQLYQQIEALRAAEARQELNAQKAETRAKRADFLGRLEITRTSLAERLAELEALEKSLQRPSASPSAGAPLPHGTPTPAIAAAQHAAQSETS